MNIYLFIIYYIVMAFILCLFKKLLTEDNSISFRKIVMSFIFATVIPMLFLIANNYPNKAFDLDLPYVEIQSLIPQNGGSIIINASYIITALVILTLRFKKPILTK